MGHLVLVRHGESRWNLSNRFTGWVDVPLSKGGVREAERVAVGCERHGYTAAYTSELTRAQATLIIILSRQDRTAVIHHGKDQRYAKWVRLSTEGDGRDLPVYERESLNERYYGGLQGMNKDDAERKFGKKKVLAWRRGYDDRPPGGETLRETYMRALPCLKREILPLVRAGGDVLVVAHGNTLRAIIKHLEDISDEDIADVDLPEAKPVIYRFELGAFVRTAGDYRFGRPLR